MLARQMCFHSFRGVLTQGLPFGKLLVLPRREFFVCASRHLPVIGATKRPYLVDTQEHAQALIDATGLTDVSQGCRGAIFHANPGKSVLIESLLVCCDQQQVAWEPRSTHADYLSSLVEKYHSYFTYCKKSLLRDPGFKAFTDLCKNTDDCVYHVKIVGSIPEMQSYVSFITLTESTEKFRSAPWRFDTVEHILIVDGLEYCRMNQPEYFWKKSRGMRTALYHLFLNHELLLKLPLSAAERKYMSKKKCVSDYDIENMYIVRLSLRSDLNSVCKRADVVAITRLLRLTYHRKGRRVIPTMEHWCPDIGPILIENGISMMDRFLDIPLDMWPSIYEAVVASSQFKNSPLFNILEYGDANIVSEGSRRRHR